MPNPTQTSYGFAKLYQIFRGHDPASKASSENKIDLLLHYAEITGANFYFNAPSEPDVRAKRIAIPNNKISELLEDGELRKIFLDEARNPMSSLIVDYEGQKDGAKKFADFMIEAEKYKKDQATLIVYANESPFRNKNLEFKDLKALYDTCSYDISVQFTQKKAENKFGGGGVDYKDYPYSVSLAGVGGVVTKEYIDGVPTVSRHNVIPETDVGVAEALKRFEPFLNNDHRKDIPIIISGSPEKIEELQKNLSKYNLTGPVTKIEFNTDAKKLAFVATDAAPQLEARVGVAKMPPTAPHSFG